MRHVVVIRALVAAAILMLAPGLASADDDDDEQPPPPAQRHGGFSMTVDRTRQTVPNGARFVEGWAGEDAVLLAHHFEMAGGPGLAFHGFSPTTGNAGLQSWGAGGHLALSLEVVRAASLPILLRFEGAVFSKHAFTDRAIRTTIAITVHFW